MESPTEGNSNSTSENVFQPYNPAEIQKQTMKNDDILAQVKFFVGFIRDS